MGSKHAFARNYLPGVMLEPGGLVIGKRFGTSQSIGAKARKAREKHDGKEQDQ